MRPSLVRSRTSYACVVPLLLAAACSSDSTPPVASCAAAYTPSILAHVRDSVTDAPIADAALGVIQDRTIVDTLRYFGSDEIAGGGKAGTYSVVISRAGYADWTITNIQVTPTGYCNTVNTATLQVKMVPTP